MQDRRYVLISPCRDEAERIRHTLESVMAESIALLLGKSRRTLKFNDAQEAVWRTRVTPQVDGFSS